VIHHYQKEAERKPRNEPEPFHLRQLGDALRERFERFDTFEDLDRAVSSYQKAVEFTPDDAHKPPHLHRLGSALQARFERLDNLEDLDGAISNFQKAVEFTPEDAHKPPNLHRLGGALQTRFKRLNNLGDLERAISNYQRAVEFTPDDDPNKSLFLDDLGGSQRVRFERLRSPKDLGSALSSARKAVELTPDQYPNKPLRVTRLKELEEAKAKSARDKGKDGNELKPVQGEHIAAEKRSGTRRVGDWPPVELDIGMAGEKPPGIPKEYSGWDVYNNEAKEVDTELVNDWRDSLNSLLLFVSTFDTTPSPPNSIHTGGHICRCTYRFHHREQEDARTRSRRNNG
jgi:tetratricopeptide (TPR) repeat protein